jgi:hypothetical protein
MLPDCRRLRDSPQKERRPVLHQETGRFYGPVLHQETGRFYG